LKRGDRLIEARRRWIKNDPCETNAVVQSFVRKHNAVLLNLRFQTTAATFPLHTAQLENIGKISIEFDSKGNIDSCASVVMDSKTLVTRFVPQNLRSKHVHSSSWNYYLAVPPRIGVRGIDRHDCVVFSDRRTQQQRAVLA
jgi:hypothetical protein